jgi:hypothetical protein
MFMGLSAPLGHDTPAARRAYLRELPEDALAAQLVELAEGLRGLGLEPALTLARGVGLPLGEVVASPFALRAVAMAHAIGAAAPAHELRWHIPWGVPEGDDEGAAAVADEEHGQWLRGVLHVGKYQAFCQDDPLSTYNPNHMSKWGPHELLHRVCRFFWRADMTRWEAYLGARLNELVPVVAWYGPDEVLRLDRDGFEREREVRQPHAEPSRALWLADEPDALLARARRTARYLVDGLAHFEREWAAIHVEIETGTRTSLRHPFLDASSDAIAYVVGHWERLTSAAYADRVVASLDAERDYFTSIRAYRSHVEAVLDELLFAPIPLDVAGAERERARRLEWDTAARAAKLDLARSRGASLDPGATTAAQALAANGLTLNRVALDQLFEGLESVIPATLTLLAAREEGGFPAWLEAFARSPHLQTRGSLASRFESFGHRFGLPAPLLALANLERLIAQAQRADDRVERLGFDEDDTPDDNTLLAGHVVANQAFALHEFRYDVASLHAAAFGEELPDELPEEQPTSYLLGMHHGAVSLLPAPSGVMHLWVRLGQGSAETREALALLELNEPGDGLPETAEGWLRELLAAGAVAWAPKL